MSSRGLILIGVDTREITRILKKLQPEQQNQALKKALRETAKKARERLGERAQETYTVKNVTFRKEMKIRVRREAALIQSEGQPLPLRSFRVSARKKGVSVQILKRGQLKELVKKRGNIRAFVNNIARRGQTRRKATTKGAAGSAVRHFAVAQRAGKKRLGIQEKYGNSVPVMLGSPRYVYGLEEPYIAETLQEALSRGVDRILGGTG